MSEKGSVAGEGLEEEAERDLNPLASVVLARVPTQLLF